MEVRILGTIAFLFVIQFCAPTIEANPVIATESVTSEEQKIIEECQHYNYKNYLKCLKRQKRFGSYHMDTDQHCMESCLKKCDVETECDKKCSHCLKKTKHRHQIITEYEADCTNADCNENGGGLGSTNITTNIGINNVINTVKEDNFSCCPHCHPPTPCPPFQPPPYQPSSLTLVPQITLGLGISGCVIPNQWPCVTPYGGSTGNVDCSGCGGNPFLGFKCDVTCYTQQGRRFYNHIQRKRSPEPAAAPCEGSRCSDGGANGTRYRV